MDVLRRSLCQSVVFHPSAQGTLQPTLGLPKEFKFPDATKEFKRFKLLGLPCSCPDCLVSSPPAFFMILSVVLCPVC